MALTWDLSEIKDHDSVCFYEATEDNPNHGITKGDRLLHPVTNTLIMLTMAVGIGQLTEENAPEFFARLRLVEKLDGPFLIRAVDPETGKRPEGSAAWITTDEVRAHVGLRCNVSFETRAKWLKRLQRDLDAFASKYKLDAEKATIA